MKFRNIALIAAGIAIYITLALIHAANKPEPIDKNAITADYSEQQAHEQKDLLEPEKLPVNQVEEKTEALQPDPVTMQETMEKQSNHIQILESQLAGQTKDIQELSAKKEQLSQQLQQQTKVMKQLMELNKRLENELQAETLKQGKLIPENNQL